MAARHCAGKWTIGRKFPGQSFGMGKVRDVTGCKQSDQGVTQGSIVTITPADRTQRVASAKKVAVGGGDAAHWSS